MGKRKGFTLAELIVTMVIIGILSAVAMPMYTDYVQRSRIVKIEADGESIEEAVLLAIIEMKIEKYDGADFDQEIQRRIRKSLPAIRNLNCKLAKWGENNYSPGTWFVMLSRNSAKPTSVYEIEEFRINGANDWTYTGKYQNSSKYYQRTIKIKN